MDDNPIDQPLAGSADDEDDQLEGEARGSEEWDPKSAETDTLEGI